MSGFPVIAFAILLLAPVAWAGESVFSVREAGEMGGFSFGDAEATATEEAGRGCW